MRKLKAFGIGLFVVGLAVLPGIGAGYELSAALARPFAPTKDDRRGEIETIGTYEVNPETMEAAIRLHRVYVRR